MFVFSKFLITKALCSIAKTMGPWTRVFTWKFRNFVAFFLFSQISSEKGKMIMMLKVFLKSGFSIMFILTCLNSILLSLALDNACSSLKLLYTSLNSAYREDIIKPMGDHKRGFSHKFMCLLMKISRILMRISKFHELFSIAF